MNLHRTTGRPDWVAIDPREHTSWHKLAVLTGGVVTPGNLATVVGLVLVLAGLVALLAHDYWLASGLIIVGRLCDLVDGWLADVTQTKSPLGELMDAGADKIETFAAIIVMYIAVLAPWWILTLLVVPHVLTSILAAIARLKGVSIHPSRIGKVSMALLWVCLVALLLVRIASLGGVAVYVAYGLVAVTSILALGALVGYVRLLRAK